MTTNTFILNWVEFKGYANPPWNLITRVLTQTRIQQVRLVLMAPVWRAQPWYPILLEMIKHKQVLLPNKPDLIQPTHRVNCPDMITHLFRRLDYLRDRFKNQEISEEASTLLLASWRNKIAKSYDSLFGRWVSWYSERDTDPISGNIASNLSCPLSHETLCLLLHSVPLLGVWPVR